MQDRIEGNILVTEHQRTEGLQEDELEMVRTILNFSS